MGKKVYAVIRIKGKFNVPKEIEDTLKMLNLERSNSCSIVISSPQNEGMIRKVKDFVAYGEISKEILKKLLKKWGRVGKKRLDENYDVDKIVDEIFENGKKLKDFGINPFFRLHPPRKGFRSVKKHYPKGSLGYHGNDINDLIDRMS